MGSWWSAGSIAAVLAAVAVLSSRTVNRRTSARFRAALVDVAIAAGVQLAVSLPFAAPMLMVLLDTGRLDLGYLQVPALVTAVPATVYLLARDGLPGRRLRGRSPGKKLRHVRIACTDDRTTTLLRSLTRNAPLAVAPLLMVPWAAPAVAAMLLVETTLAWRDPEGLRLGDRLAGTRVLLRSRQRRRSAEPAIDGAAAEPRAEAATP